MLNNLIGREAREAPAKNIFSSKADFSTDQLPQAKDPQTSAGWRGRAVPINHRHPGTPPMRQLTIRPECIPTQLHILVREQPALRKNGVMAATVLQWFQKNGIEVRFAGSLLAKVYASGTPRKPEDIDVEVGSAEDLNKAFAGLSRFSGMVKMPDGRTMHLQAKPLRHVDGMSGVVELIFTEQNGRQHRTTVDITNENNPNFNQFIYSPRTRGVRVSAEKPGVVQPHEMIMNYLDRSLQKPELSIEKQDMQQIAALLRSEGFDARHPKHRAELRRDIAQRVRPEMRPVYIERLDSVMHAMATHAL